MGSSDVLLSRGWRVRWVWQRSYDRKTFVARLRYLLTADSWGVDESAYEWRIHRLGPVYVDTLCSRRALAAKGVELVKSVLYWRDLAEERHRELILARAELRELKHAHPMLRTESVRGGN